MPSCFVGFRPETHTILQPYPQSAREGGSTSTIDGLSSLVCLDVVLCSGALSPFAIHAHLRLPAPALHTGRIRRGWRVMTGSTPSATRRYLCATQMIHGCWLSRRKCAGIWAKQSRGGSISTNGAASFLTKGWSSMSTPRLRSARCHFGGGLEINHSNGVRMRRPPPATATCTCNSPTHANTQARTHTHTHTHTHAHMHAHTDTPTRTRIVGTGVGRWQRSGPHGAHGLMVQQTS